MKSRGSEPPYIFGQGVKKKQYTCHRKRPKEGFTERIVNISGPIGTIGKDQTDNSDQSNPDMIVVSFHSSFKTCKDIQAYPAGNGNLLISGNDCSGIVFFSGMSIQGVFLNKTELPYI